MYRYASTCLTGPVSHSRVWGQDGSEDFLRGDSSGCRDSLDGPDKSELRLDLIARVRKEIAAGTYDTPERWEAALDRLLESLDQG